MLFENGGKDTSFIPIGKLYFADLLHFPSGNQKLSTFRAKFSVAKT